MKRLALVAALAFATPPACYGSYSATKAVHRWNGTATGNRMVNSAIHLGLWVVPIYQLIIFSDFIVFNNIEFITGTSVFK